MDGVTLVLGKVSIFSMMCLFQHNQHLAETKDREPDVLWIGDSIMSHLKQRPMWNDLFEPLHSLNFGVSGDSTQHVLWRIKNGALDNIKPKVFFEVLNIYFACFLILAPLLLTKLFLLFFCFHSK